MAKPVYITEAGLEKLKTELAELMSQRKALADRIKGAREFGDLSENAEYEDARNQQAFNEGRLLELQEKIKNAQVIADTNGGPVGLGSTVTIELPTGPATYTVVGSTEADPASGRISSESPIGQALMGAKKGDTVTADTPGGQLQIKITP